MKIFITVMATVMLSINGYAQKAVALDQKEMNGIVYMREEEKLARDVYDSLYAKWRMNPFGNIRKSEQVHMNRMKELTDWYKLTDPVTKSHDKPGVFVNESLQKYYNELIASGSQSFIDALKAGARIEELDISDLNKYAESTDRKNILDTYAYLKMASENHLRAFVHRLNMSGIHYSPVILTNQEFQNIISGK